ncbi:histidine-type phosphatase [Phenylobacterium sp.]|uniref:histidine-type phosphatase n=1 Tax=Phenylobacterium sp. TaxID=1871053 RepID=UPI0035B3111B
MKRLVVLILLLAAWTAAPASAEPLKLERVVMLTRHGVRPPTKAEVTPPGVAADPWPQWNTPYGHLTAHGYAAIRLLGAADRMRWSKAGLLPRRGCPAPGEVVVWSDSDERTIRTGDALLEGLAPGCGLVNGHNPEGEDDPLFSPPERASMDPAAARAAIVEAVGPLDAVAAAHRQELDALGRVLGCCAAPACPSAAASCSLADLQSAFVDGGGRPKLSGPLDFGPTAAQTLMLEYVEGLPMAEVGWGRATRQDIEQLMGLHAMKGEVLQRPLYIAARGAGPLLKRMLEALNGPARLTVLVGHDTNISEMSGLLGFDWHVPSYPANTPPPGGAFGLALYEDAAGKRFVRAFYRSQTMDQMRDLTPLDARSPPFFQWLTIDGCGAADRAASCALETLERLAETRLAAAR